MNRRPLGVNMIAILYLLPITAMFFIGAYFMVVVRLHLMTPEGALLIHEGVFHRANVDVVTARFHTS